MVLIFLIGTIFSIIADGVKPAVLPSLQELFKEKLAFGFDITTIDYLEDLQIPPQVLHPKNQQSLEELLLGFFDYYANFE